MPLTSQRRAEISAPESLKSLTSTVDPNAKPSTPTPCAPTTAPADLNCTPLAAATAKRLNMVHPKEKREHVDFLLEGDIHGAIFRNLHGLDELKIPESAISLKLIDVFNALKQAKRFYIKNGWVNWPVSIDKEPEKRLAKLMNDIGTHITKTFKPTRKSSNSSSPHPSPSPRKWTARYEDTTVPHDSCERKPDVVLMNQRDANAKRAPGWDKVLAIVELKLGRKPEQDPVEQLAQYARLVFGEQPDRLFLLGVTIIRTNMTFVVFNRSGLLVSDSFDVNEHPLRFLRVVAMMFLDREYLGFDRRFDYTPVDGKPSRTITVNGETYKVQEILYIESVIRGRGTVCLSVKPKNGGENLVVKSSWVDVTRKLREPQILEDLKDVPGITRLQNSETLDYRTRTDFDGTKVREITIPEESGKVDRQTRQTINRRKKEKEKVIQERNEQSERIENREPVRVVLTPLGTSMLKFKSLRELVRAMVHIVEAMEGMKEKDYIHRDISLRNIMLGGEENEKGERNGVLIDFDYAIRKLAGRILASAQRTGTIPFMAIEVLKAANGFEHEYFHDLESLFYVLCFICCAYEGPGSDGQQVNISGTSIAGWFAREGENFSEIGGRKTLTVETPTKFKESILTCVQPAFAPLKDCLEELRAVVIPPDVDLVKVMLRVKEVNPTHTIDFQFTDYKTRKPETMFKKVKEALWKAYANLPETSTTTEDAEHEDQETNPAGARSDELLPLDSKGKKMAGRARDIHAYREAMAQKARVKEQAPEQQAPEPTLQSYEVVKRRKQISRSWNGSGAKRKPSPDNNFETLVANKNVEGLKNTITENARRRARNGATQMAPKLDTVHEEGQVANPPPKATNRRSWRA